MKYAAQFLLITLFCTSDTLASIRTRVELTNGTISNQVWNSGGPIQIQGGNSLRFVTVTADDPDIESVGVITISGSSSSTIQLIFGQTTRAWTCLNWAGLDPRNNAGVRVSGRIRGDLLASVDCATFDFQVDGTIAATVTHRSANQMSVFAGQIGLEQSINSQAGLISTDGGPILLRTLRLPRALPVGLPDTTGDILWRIEATATAGRIQEILCEGNLRADVTSAGSIGSITVPVSFAIRQDPAEQTTNRVNITAKDGIALVQAGRGRVNIIANNSGGIGSLLRLNILRDSGVSASGDLSGDIATQSIPLVSGTPTQAAWTIGRTLSANVVAASGALPGQVIINSANASGTWSGTTTINGQTLSGLPNYTLPSLVLGNGAIGKAPFALYATDCMPRAGSPCAIGQSQFQSTTSPMPVQVRFYGPVRVAAGVSVINALTITGPNSTTLDARQYFTASIQTVGGVNREIRIGDNPSNTVPVGVYRVQPVVIGSNALLCDQVAGTVPVSGFAAPYQFEIAALNYCPNKDYNCDEFYDPDDLSDFITDFFTVPAPWDPPSRYSLPCGTVAPYNQFGYRADINHDCAVDPDDLSDFITIFFAPGCP